MSGHLSPTSLVAAYENHSSKRPAPVTDIFIASRGCPLTRASTVVNPFFTITAEIHARSLANFYCQYADRHMNLNSCDASASESRQFDNLLS